MSRSLSIPSRPRWLDEEALPRRLLEIFLNKLEAGQRLSLKISAKTAPELYDFQNEDVKFLWELVKSLDKEFHILTIKLARTRPNQEVYEDAKLVFVPEQEDLVRHWLNRPALDPYALVWQAQLARMREQFEDGGAALAEKMVRTEQGPEVTLRAFARAGQELQKPVTLRALSARCFWGDSKFLDRSEDLIKQMFPSLAHNLVPRPILLAVHLPQRLENVLFVENQDTFIALTQLDLPGYALVYSGGFRGSGGRVRETGNALFSFINPGQHGDLAQQFGNWWFARTSHSVDSINAWFWGDLDFAGMAILKALRQPFPHIEPWRPGYQPLLERLREGWGHSHESSGKNLQKDPQLTGCTWADEELLPAMRETGCFVDQEAVSVSDLEFGRTN